MRQTTAGYSGPVTSQEPSTLREALKTVGVHLKESGIPFALVGGYALWARGGPEPSHDVDFMVAEEDAAAAADLLAGQGLKVVEPPEDWLFKVFVDNAMVDVLFRANSQPVQRETLLADAELMEVESVLLPVLSATDLMIQRLNAMEEHACNFGTTLPVARAVREQVDWEQVRDQTRDNPFASAFVFLLERLGVISEAV